MTWTIPVSDTLQQRLAGLYGELDARFHNLVRAAALDPRRDFRFRDLRALQFQDADLTGFDFTDSDLRGTGLRFAARVVNSTILSGAMLDQEDANWHDQRLRDVPIADAELAEDLRLAVTRGQLDLVFQPKVSLNSKSVTGAEALLRWHHPAHGIISPARFIPMLEELGHIEEVTYWTIETAVEQQRLLVRAGIDLTITINISTMLLERPGFITDCGRLVRGQRAALRFEITESVFFMESDALIRHLDQLASMGISISIDNYGTGFSSLALLKRIPASELKIDRSLINNLTADNSDPLVVRSTIDLAHAFGWEVTAEGVETSAQLALLTALGCDAAQGFLIGRPMTIHDLANFVTTGVDVDAQLSAPLL